MYLQCCCFYHKYPLISMLICIYFFQFDPFYRLDCLFGKFKGKKNYFWYFPDLFSDSRCWRIVFVHVNHRLQIANNYIIIDIQSFLPHSICSSHKSKNCKMKSLLFAALATTLAIYAFAAPGKSISKISFFKII